MKLGCTQEKSKQVLVFPFICTIFTDYQSVKVLTFDKKNNIYFVLFSLNRTIILMNSINYFEIMAHVGARESLAAVL